MCERTRTSRSENFCGKRQMSDVPPCLESLTSNQRARRERILDSALALLKQSDFDKIQMRDVADAADVALGTVYRYFPSKEYLFAAVLVQWSETMPSADVSIDGTNNPAGALNTVMCAILDAFGRHPQILRLFIVLDQTPDRYARELHAS